MDLDQIRKDTPGCRHVIHFNNAGASLQPIPIFEKIKEYQQYEFLHGGYETAEKFGKELNDTYNVIATFINANKDEIALVENATAAWDMAFHSIDFDPGDEVLTSVAEYASNFIAYLQAERRLGIKIIVVDNDDQGQMSLMDLKQKINPAVKLISVTHMPTNSGLLNPAEEIGKIAKEHDILFLLDACQSVGHYPIDVNSIQCDFLSATGRKYLRGPRGTGFLYVRKKVLVKMEPVFLDLHSATWTDTRSYSIREDAKRFENWESNYSLRLGLREAVRYATRLGIQNIWDRIEMLARKFRDNLNTINGIRTWDEGVVKGGIVTFNIKNETAYNIKSILRQNHINVSVAEKSSSLLDMSKKNVNSLVRASVHYYNSISEIDHFCDLVAEIANGHRP